MTSEQHLIDWATDLVQRAFEVGFVFGNCLEGEEKDMSHEEFLAHRTELLAPIIDSIKGNVT